MPHAWNYYHVPARRPAPNLLFSYSLGKTFFIYLLSFALPAGIIEQKIEGSSFMFTLAFAQDVQAPVQGATQQSSLISLLPILLIFVIFYFILIKPQKKAQAEHAKMLETLKKNDEVVTSGGIMGTITNVQNDIITLRVDDNTKLKIQKGFISKLKRAKGAEQEVAPK